jgi:hypothetical protein
MFCIVNEVDGAGVIEYHYSLILGMLKSKLFLSLVLIGWSLYARKVSAYVNTIVRKPEFAFLAILNSLSKFRRTKLFLFLQFLLLLPVLLYALFVVIIGWQLHYYPQVLAVIIFLLLLVFFGANYQIKLLEARQPRRPILWRPITRWRWIEGSYPAILLQFIATRQPISWLVIKIFTCGIVFLIARNNTATDYDISFPFLFFNFGILANSILVYRIRELPGFLPGIARPIGEKIPAVCLDLPVHDDTGTDQFNPAYPCAPEDYRRYVIYGKRLLFTVADACRYLLPWKQHEILFENSFCYFLR